jgi:exopolyphosphatase / guanosine-5'-triphosphate,3'-diphosphate pyrophosphatase
MRIAVFDIGTNSIHMMVAEIRPDGTFKVIDREKDATRLGDGSFERGRLKGSAMRRGWNVIERFHRMARKYKVRKVVGVATSAVRDASNGAEFVREIRRRTGTRIEVISGQEEGRLIELAARSNFDLKGKSSLVIDLGGGSLELIVGDGKKHKFLKSFPLGVARLTDRFLTKDPPSKKQLRKLEKHIEKKLAEPVREIRRLRTSTVIGTAGTMINLVSMVYESATSKELKLKHHHPLDRSKLERVHAELIALPLRKRLNYPGLDSKRADIIVAGSLVVLTLMRMLDIPRILVSKRGIREGMVLDLIAKNRKRLSGKKW